MVPQALESTHFLLSSAAPRVTAPVALHGNKAQQTHAKLLSMSDLPTVYRAVHAGHKLQGVVHRSYHRSVLSLFTKLSSQQVEKHLNVYTARWWEKFSDVFSAWRILELEW